MRGGFQMLWFVFLLLFLSACETSDTTNASTANLPSSSTSAPKLDSAPTGSICDTPPVEDVRDFAPAAGVEGSTALGKDSPAIVAWASRVIDLDFGDNVDDQWRTRERALGPAEGTTTDVVSLGEGGIITLGFEKPIADGEGFDFCVFENSFSDDFLEFAYVEVASSESRFVRFAATSLVPDPVDAYGTIDPTRVDGMAGKYRRGFCTPFDLSLLANRAEAATGELDLYSIRYVRVRDLIGDGRNVDCASHPIYDPYPTTGSAGFDLDAIAVLSQAL
jgi:hypothetical protein